MQIKARQNGGDDDSDMEADGPEKPLKPADEFDLLRLKMLNFSCSLLSSASFARQISLSLAKGEDIEQQLQLLIQCAILNVDTYEKEARNSKIHRHLVGYSEKALEASLSILPGKTFVSVLRSLLANSHDLVRRKALEVFNSKLQPTESDLVSEGSVLDLLKPLVQLAKGSYKEDTQETAFNQQLAMLALRSFARRLGARNPIQFKTDACQEMSSKSFLRGLDANATVVAAAMLCLTEIFQSIGPHAVASLPPFVNWLLAKISADSDEELSSILLNSLILAVQKLMENFSGFLNPYFKKFVVSACRLAQMQQEAEPGQQRYLASRSKHLQSSVAMGIPTHALLPICRDCFDELVINDGPPCVSALANIIHANVSALDKSRALAVTGPFMDFFLHAFKYRQMVVDVDEAKVCEVEDDVISAFLSLTLKLSLEDFKPLFYRVFNLATAEGDSGSVDAVTTVYHVALAVADRLKSLSEFVCEALVQRSTNMLVVFSCEDFSSLRAAKSEAKSSRMLEYILDSLAAIFAHNKVDALLTKNYEEHVNALMLYFEFAFEDEKRQAEFFKKMTTCLAALAGSTDDETQWKYLNYQVLLNLRSSSPGVRMCVLGIVNAFVERKGENYLSVLPDAVPFLYETMEDEDPKLEAACKALVKGMEQVFGQSVSSYFE